jgi:ubiquinone/menaquinone biosynthesis C-methylase UbiE
MSDIKKKTIDHWTSVPIGTQTTGFAARHDQFTKEYFEEHSRFRYEVYAPWLANVARFAAYSGQSILEVGCGMGTDLLEYARTGADVVGLDLTPRHLELAQRRFRLFDLDGLFVNGDAEHLCFRDNSFDFVFSNGVLHHTPDTQQAVDEIHRVLKPGGEALILLYHRRSLHYYLRILLESGSKRFLRHVVNGKRLSDFSYAQVLSASTDGELNPLTKVYSRRQGRILMRKFSMVHTEVYHLNRGDFPFSGIVPSPVLRSLSRSLGWYLVLRGTKERPR